MALGKKRLGSHTEERSKQLYDVYQKFLEERIISEIDHDEIIAQYKIVTQQKSCTKHLLGNRVNKVISVTDLLKVHVLTSLNC